MLKPTGPNGCPHAHKSAPKPKSKPSGGCPFGHNKVAEVETPVETVTVSKPTPQETATSLAEQMKAAGCPTAPGRESSPKTREMLRQTEVVANKVTAGATTGPAAAVLEHQQATRGGICPFLSRILKLNAPSEVTERVGAIEFAKGILKHHKDPVEFFEQFHQEHGESFQVAVPGRRMIFDHRPEVVKKALLSTDPRKGEGSFSKPDLQGHGLSFLLGKDNVFLAGGETWRSVHDIVAPQFSSKKIGSDQFMGTMGKAVDAHIDRLKSEVGEGKEIDIREEMQRATLDVALRTLLGTTLSSEQLQETQNSFQVMMANLSLETLNPTNISVSNLPWKGDLKRAYAQLDGLAESIIKEKKKAPPEDNVIGALLEADLPHKRIKNELLTILLAGHETTATLLSWTFGELARDSELQDQLRQETQPVANGSARDLRSAKLAKNTIKESLRLYSPAYFLVREAESDQVMETDDGPMTFERGDQLVMSSYNMHRNPEDWGDRADEFDPRRFEESKGGFMAPFGAGSRTCLGSLMARTEASMILARYLQNFDFQAEGELGMISDVSVSPENSKMMVKPRRGEWNFAA